MLLLVSMLGRLFTYRQFELKVVLLGWIFIAAGQTIAQITPDDKATCQRESISCSVPTREWFCPLAATQSADVRASPITAFTAANHKAAALK